MGMELCRGQHGRAESETMSLGPRCVPQAQVLLLPTISPPCFCLISKLCIFSLFTCCSGNTGAADLDHSGAVGWNSVPVSSWLPGPWQLSCRACCRGNRDKEVRSCAGRVLLLNLSVSVSPSPSLCLLLSYPNVTRSHSVLSPEREVCHTQLCLCTHGPGWGAMEVWEVSSSVTRTGLGGDLEFRGKTEEGLPTQLGWWGMGRFPR